MDNKYHIIIKENRINQLMGVIEDLEGKMLLDSRPALEQGIHQAIEERDIGKMTFYINKLSKILDKLTANNE